MTVAIATFLTARYGERGQRAQAAIACAQRFDWQPSGEWHVERGRVEDDEGFIVVYDEGAPTEEQAEHIALNHPAYVLADIEAKRAVLAEVESWTHHYNDEDPWHSCSQAVSNWQDDKSPGSGCSDDERRGKPCDCDLDRRRLAILAPMARPFTGHPDFEPAWSVAI